MRRLRIRKAGGFFFPPIVCFFWKSQLCDFWRHHTPPPPVFKVRRWQPARCHDIRPLFWVQGVALPPTALTIKRQFSTVTRESHQNFAANHCAPPKASRKRKKSNRVKRQRRAVQTHFIFTDSHSRCAPRFSSFLNKGRRKEFKLFTSKAFCSVLTVGIRGFADF